VQVLRLFELILKKCILVHEGVGELIFLSFELLTTRKMYRLVACVCGVIGWFQAACDSVDVGVLQYNTNLIFPSVGAQVSVCPPVPSTGGTNGASCSVC
jgi:hypothetical protein